MMRRPRGGVVMVTAGDLMVVRPKRFVLPMWLVVLGLVLRWAARFCWWCLRHPVTVGMVVTAVVLYADYGWPGLVVPLVLASAVSAVWRWRDETSWWRWCAGPLLGRFRQVFVYRWAWQEAMTLCGLAATYDHLPVLPQLLRVRSDQALDVLTVRMVRGQTPADFQQVTANLAYAFGRRHARV
nr:hypothetical protein [Micromonospora humidisoli]